MEKDRREKAGAHEWMDGWTGWLGAQRFTSKEYLPDGELCECKLEHIHRGCRINKPLNFCSIKQSLLSSPLRFRNYLLVTCIPSVPIHDNDCITWTQIDICMQDLETLRANVLSIPIASSATVCTSDFEIYNSIMKTSEEVSIFDDSKKREWRRDNLTSTITSIRFALFFQKKKTSYMYLDTQIAFLI